MRVNKHGIAIISDGPRRRVKATFNFTENRRHANDMIRLARREDLLKRQQTETIQQGESQ